MNEDEELGSKRNKEIISMTNKSRKIEKDKIISVESRIISIRKTRYRINEKIAIDKNYTINQTQTKDKTGKIVSEVIRVAQKESRRNEAIFTINVFRTKSSFLINGSQVQKLLLKIRN